MMEDRISLDHISTQPKYNLQDLCSNDPYEDNDVSDSPFDIITNTCKYYELNELKQQLKHNQNCISMCSLNCQGLRSHWDAFCKLMISDNTGLFDIIGITELFGMSVGECALNGYHPLEYRTRNDTDRSRGGVGIYVKNNLSYKIRHDLSIFIPHICESLFIEVQCKNKNIIVGIIYRPNTPPRADLDVFMHTLHELQQNLNNEHADSFLLGDFNIDLLRFSEHSKTNDFLDNTFSSGFTPLITKPTRITVTSATLIDHIYANKKLLNATSGILITDLADHFGIFTLYHTNQKNTNIKKTQKTYRSLNETNTSNFNNLLQTANFQAVFNENCPDISYNKFMYLFKEIFNTSFPIRTSTAVKKYQKHSPWITRGLVQSSVTRHQLYMKKLKQPSDDNIIRYKNFESLHKKLLRIAKQTYFRDQLEEAKFDMKKTWTILKTAINSSAKSHKLPDYFINDNLKIIDKQEIANKFNKFFANIGSIISSNVPDTDIPYTHYLKQPHHNTMFLDPTSPQEIINITSKLKSKTSQGHDEISTKLLKQCINHLASPLSHIINQSMLTGIVPSDMKLAKVIPIFKSGDQYSFNNYRPISILPAFSKILEKVIATKLIKYLESQNLLYKHQYGFRPKHSTIHPIIHLLNNITTENDKPSKNLTLAVFIDLSKAFDTINHDILLKKLDNLGVRGVSNTWFRNYLENRMQYMELNSAKSTLESLTCSVPQGSILGPILFLIYVNDICNCTRLDILSFADDTTITVSSADIDSLYTLMNSELKKLDCWFRANRLCLNVKKTKYILFRPGNMYIDTENRNITLNNQTVDQICHTGTEKSFKFLGLYIDETLSWKHHIQKICSKISRSNYIINKVKNLLPMKSLLTLYSSIVQSHINYGLIIWGNAKTAHKIAKLQKKSIRIINCKPYRYHTEPLFKNNRILTVHDQYTHNILIFMHQLKYNKLPKSFDSLKYFEQENKRETRQINLANCFRFRTSFSSLLPYHQFPRVWNRLDVDLHGINSLGNFKRLNRKRMLNNYENLVQCTNIRCKQCFPDPT